MLPMVKAVALLLAVKVELNGVQIVGDELDMLIEKVRLGSIPTLMTVLPTQPRESSAKTE